MSNEMTERVGKQSWFTAREHNKSYKVTHTIGLEYWFVKDYFLHVQLAWTTLVIHVGEQEIDRTRPLILKLEIPVIVKPK